MAENEKLRLWQERLAINDSAYSAEIGKMDDREAIYKGKRTLKPITENDKKKSGESREALHVRNIAAENIESMVSAYVPQPKVTAKRKEDEPKAKLIEDMLRNEMNRLPFEEMNDVMERTVPIQGGAYFLVEWDNTKCTHNTTGEITVSVVHPKQTVPQDGVYTSVEDMDYFILKLPQTKEYIRRRYGVEVQDETETEPDLKSSGSASTAEDMVTQYIAYYRNDDGGIGLYSWVCDTELEDIEDYQARHLPRCAKCGALKPLNMEEKPKAKGLGNFPNMPGGGDMAAEIMKMTPQNAFPAGVAMLGDAELHEEKTSGDVCPYCGSDEWQDAQEDYEEIYLPVHMDGGREIPGASPALDDNGMPYMRPTRVPFYKPDIYPVVLQKNVSVFGQLLGDSDIDKIADQQNTINRLEMKIIDRIIKAGSRITLPRNATINLDSEDSERIYLDNAADKAMISTYDFTGNLQYEMAYLSGTYEEARQILGITDSFQGRADSTATSGKAKEFAAAQSAGRLESKRVMKNAAYAKLFEMIFKFKLAYADEPRPVVAQDDRGNKRYENFNRYDFLEVDAAGEYYWNDQFLFSCDSSAPLAQNREQMWENTTAHFSSGAYGDPSSIDTLILYWTKMEMLHYPGAADTKAYLEEQKKEQMAMQQQQMMQQQMMQSQQMAMQQQGQYDQMIRDIDAQARADARSAVMGQKGAR